VSLVVFCLFAVGESIGDEPNSDRFRFFGVVCGVVCGVGVRGNPPGF
jgi:hypothetical protein